VVANHVNGLVDPLLILGFLPVRPRFLAKSTLWRNPLLRPVLALGGVIPVYRRSDAGVDPAQNLATFDRCWELLAAGGSVALFPEGVSHSEPALQPLRTGAARIALEAERRFGPLGVAILPVGLVYDARETFRSRALVQVGPPVPVDADARRGDGDQERVRELTGRIREALDRVTLGYASWQEAALVERAADLYAESSSELPGDRPLAERVAIRRVVIDRYGELRQQAPEAVHDLAEQVAAYDRLLRVTRLRDDQVAALYPRRLVAAFAARTLLRLLVTLPLAAVGSVLNWPPYRIAGRLADRFSPGADTRATYKLFSSLLLYPATWTLEAVAAGLAAGPRAAVAVALLAPVAGWAAAVFHQRRRRLALETRAWLILRRHRGLVEELRARRAELRRTLAALAEQLEPGPEVSS
jgi:1-acyl-sn-glycerol-3-phosphate acyltransferase